MPGIRNHMVWEITYTIEMEAQEQVSHDESRGTGNWYMVDRTLRVIAPDNEAMVRAWYERYTKYVGGRNKQLIAVNSYPLTAFIQEHIY